MQRIYMKKIFLFTVRSICSIILRLVDIISKFARKQVLLIAQTSEDGFVGPKYIKLFY